MKLVLFLRLAQCVILATSVEAATLGEEIAATRKIQGAPVWAAVLAAADKVNAIHGYTEESPKLAMQPLGYSVLPGMSGQRFLSVWWINHPDRQLVARVTYEINAERSHVDVTALETIGMFGRWIKGVTIQVPVEAKGDIGAVSLAVSKDGMRTEAVNVEVLSK